MKRKFTDKQLIKMKKTMKAAELVIKNVGNQIDRELERIGNRLDHLDNYPKPTKEQETEKRGLDRYEDRLIAILPFGRY